MAAWSSAMSCARRLGRCIASAVWSACRPFSARALRNASNRSVARQHVEPDLLALAPIGRDLQDGGAGQAAMGEQHGLGEFRLAAGRHRIDRDARERREARQQVRLQRQRHQRGARLGDAQAELRGRCRSRSPSRPSWGSTCRRRRPPARSTATVPSDNVSAKPSGVFSMRSTLVERRRFRRCRFMPDDQHVDDLARGAVAEKLAEGLFVIGDAVAVPRGRRSRLACSASAPRCRSSDWPR